MRLLGLILSAVLSASAFGYTGGTSVGTTTNTTTTMPYYGWNVEAAVQFISMADDTDALVGSSLFYELTEYFELGLQTFLTTNAGGNSTARFAARQYFTDGRTKLFFQPAVGYNLHRREESKQRVIETGSLSADVGIKHRVYKQIHVGGTSGLELVDRGRYYREPEADRNYVLTPKVALMTNVMF